MCKNHRITIATIAILVLLSCAGIFLAINHLSNRIDITAFEPSPSLRIVPELDVTLMLTNVDIREGNVHGALINNPGYAIGYSGNFMLE